MSDLFAIKLGIFGVCDGFLLLAIARILVLYGERRHEGFLARTRSIFFRNALMRSEWIRLLGIAFILFGSIAILYPILESHGLERPVEPCKPSVSTQGCQCCAPVVANPTSPSPPPQPVNYSSVATQTVLLLIGAALLLFGSRFRRLTPAFIGSAMMLMGLTPTIKNDFKIGDLLSAKIDVSPPRDSTTITSTSSASYEFEPLGFVKNFAPGCGNIDGSDCSSPQNDLVYERFQKTPTAEQVQKLFTVEQRNIVFKSFCQQKGIVLVIGRTDRNPLSSELRRRYESNVGLAQRRAESVKEAIGYACKLENMVLLTEVGGPKYTPKTVASDKDAYAKDRSVEIDAVHEILTTNTNLPQQGESGFKGKYNWVIGLLALIAIIVVAIALALATTLEVDLKNKVIRLIRREKKKAPAKQEPPFTL